MRKYNNLGVDMSGLSMTDPVRYRKIYAVLNDKGVKEDVLDMDTIPLEYSYALSDAGKSPEEEAFLSELKRSVTYVLSYLTAREERVIRKRFGIGLNKDETLEEIGQEFCVTRERIRGIEAKALRKLKYPTLARKLRPFLPDVIDAIYDPIL
jgi:RNA polymerase sigma factor (sigma-70 family)|tara:strand:+ start:1484 stop:1939 length:456 start_codon:yes stop_codon:yes gene_type:complete